MRSVWRRLQFAPLWVRWPIKWSLFSLVVFFVLYPSPRLFVRHLRHIRRLDSLPDPEEPALAEFSRRFDLYLSSAGVDHDDSKPVLEAVESFVCREIPYKFDWEVWGVVDYIPSLGEVIAKGEEDCDGRAVLAAALLRARGIEGQLAGDPRHLWVRTPLGETMNPLGEAAFTADRRGLHVRWPQLLDIGPPAVGITLFPLGREIVILVTAWVLLLPPAVGFKRAAIGLFVLLEGLVIIRLAGADVLEPNIGAVRWGLLHLLLAAVVLRRNRQKSLKHTGRSVS